MLIPCKVWANDQDASVDGSLTVERTDTNEISISLSRETSEVYLSLVSAGQLVAALAIAGEEDS